MQSTATTRLTVEDAATLSAMSITELIRVRRLAATGAARALRLDAGLSLSEMAEAAQVHKTTICRWETGSRRPRGEAARRYLATLEELERR